MIEILRRAVLLHRGWRYRTRVDPDEIRWMRSVLRPGDTAVDVGAHKGGYTRWMRHEVGATGVVLAFEPQPELAESLRRSVHAFGWTNVHVHPLALSCEPGTGRLYRPGTEPSPAASLVGVSLPSGSLATEVPIDTLDAVLAREATARPVRFVKCDVEGHELEVFRGAERTLKEDRPHLLVECEPRHLHRREIEEVFGYLEASGYRGSFFRNGVRHDLSDFDAARHQIAGRRPYTNDFVFEPADHDAP